ncbi:MAG: GNAT family N-acetyltransferase [Oscillospiraceae bacterium]|nr:GNAT family N-acetyltransferase [Oscillospiraceae bacterium]
MTTKSGALLRPMTIADYPAVFALWESIEGFAIRSIDDSYDGVKRFLARNPGLSVVAELDGKLVGTILCGSDGRTGYFYHVCVERSYRNHGIGSDMVRFCTEALKADGVNKISLIAFKQNRLGNSFWQSTGWSPREDVNVYDLVLNDENKIKRNL